VGEKRPPREATSEAELPFENHVDEQAAIVHVAPFLFSVNASAVMQDLRCIGDMFVERRRSRISRACEGIGTHMVCMSC
jgi:hypothetical protein